MGLQFQPSHACWVVGWHFRFQAVNMGIFPISAIHPIYMNMALVSDLVPDFLCHRCETKHILLKVISPLFFCLRLIIQDISLIGYRCLHTQVTHLIWLDISHPPNVIQTHPSVLPPLLLRYENSEVWSEKEMSHVQFRLPSFWMLCCSLLPRTLHVARTRWNLKCNVQPVSKVSRTIKLASTLQKKMPSVLCFSV